MKFTVPIILSLLATSTFAQRSGIAPRGNWNPLNPVGGVPGAIGPRMGTAIPMGPTSIPFGAIGGGPLSTVPPPAVSGPMPAPRFGGRRGFGGNYGGGYTLPLPVYGGFDGFYRSVYNPAPGTYDPIFGAYSPANYYPPEYLPNGAVQPSPAVVINQNFQADRARPQVRDYNNVNLPEPGQNSPARGDGGQTNEPSAAVEQQVYFLIALKDGNIHAAAAYWVTDNTLNFVTLQGRRSSVPLDQVDRDLSKRLNDRQAVDFGLPPQ
jgi:hypothetical protein